MIRVVLAAESTTVRHKVRDALAADLGVTVVAYFNSTAGVVEATKRLKPDIVVLGMSSPPEGVFDTTKQIMIEAPTPIAIVADADDARQVEISMKALRAGALAVLAVPKAPSDASAVAARRAFSSDIRAMSQVKVVRHWRRSESQDSSSSGRAHPNGVGKVIAIAASTGGPAALQRVLSELPADFPAPILVVQHISVGFIDGFADWLNGTCALKIKMAADGAPLQPHTVYLAGDGRHLGVTSKSTIALSDDGPIDGFKPSANYMFNSVAASYRSAGIGVILTGMGRDGLEGLRALHRAGGRIIAQDEATSVVFGMPGAAVGAGIASAVLPLSSIAARLIELVRSD